MSYRFFSVRRTRLRSCTGAAFLETALVFPLLLALLAGVYYLSTYFHAQALMTNVAHEGARFMARQPGTNSGLAFRSERDTMTSGIVNVTTGGTNIDATHLHVYQLLAAMNRRDGGFVIEDIAVETQYIGNGDRVNVRLEATLVPLLTSGSFLDPLGLANMRIQTTSSQPHF